MEKPLSPEAASRSMRVSEPGRDADKRRCVTGPPPLKNSDRAMPKIMIVTDAWHPQVNGVVRSIETTNRELAAMGYDVAMITPKPFRSIPMPTYPEIRLSLATYGQIARRIEAEKPDYMHIATEGPLGLMARRWCLKIGRAHV